MQHRYFQRSRVRGERRVGGSSPDVQQLRRKGRSHKRRRSTRGSSCGLDKRKPLESRSPGPEQKKGARHEDTAEREVRRVRGEGRVHKDQLPKVLAAPHAEPWGVNRFHLRGDMHACICIRICIRISMPDICSLWHMPTHG
jgi:hypothetical protein